MEEQRAPRVLRARWLGRIAYRDAWSLQQALAAARADQAIDEDQLLLLEHSAVLTLGRHAGASHVMASPELLAARGIEVVRVERGGEVTYHGPGQLVTYPILALAATGINNRGTSWRPLGVRRFVDALEGAMAETCTAGGVAAGPRAGHPGCWVDAGGPLPRKIGALGIRVARGVSFHGIALNITTDLTDFDLIDPCGMPGLRSTSLARERARLGLVPDPSRANSADLDDPGDADGAPTTASVANAAASFAPRLARRLGLRLEGDLPPDADPVGELRSLRALVARPGLPTSTLIAAGAG